MKKERIQLLLTVTITHKGTPASRREAIKQAKEDAMSVSTGGWTISTKAKRAVLVKRPTMFE